MAEPESQQILLRQQQIYLDVYKEYRNELRHQETQRSTMSGICVAIAGALIGLSFNKDTLHARPYFGILLVNFSIVAIAMLRKLYERFILARERAQAFLTEIDECSRRSGAFEADKEGKSLRPLQEIWNLGRDRCKERYPFSTFVRLHHLWESLLIGSGALGVVLTFYKPSASPNEWIRGSLFVLGLLLQFYLLRKEQSWEEAKTATDRDCREQRQPVTPRFLERALSRHLAQKRSHPVPATMAERVK